MPKLEKVSLDELLTELVDVTRKKPTQRLMLAILYKQGPSVPMLAEWFDMRERTIYDWFDRMEMEPLEEAIHDESPPGRPPKLSAEQRTIFESVLEDVPTTHGFDAQTWTPSVAQAFLREQFGVSYSRRHVKRLLNEIETVEQ